MTRQGWDLGLKGKCGGAEGSAPPPAPSSTSSCSLSSSSVHFVPFRFFLSLRSVRRRGEDRKWPGLALLTCPTTTSRMGTFTGIRLGSSSVAASLFSLSSSLQRDGFGGEINPSRSLRHKSNNRVVIGCRSEVTWFHFGDKPLPSVGNKDKA